MPLPREEAVARIDAFHIDGWEEAREARLKALPRKLRRAGLRMFGDSTDGQAAADHDELTEYVTMPARDRTRIFEAAFPGLGEAVERAWQLHYRLPYRGGWSRRPFRVDGRPELSLARQVGFVRRGATVLATYQKDVAWYATWSSYLGGDVGYLLAAEIDDGPQGDAVLQTLIDTVNGTHPIGMVSHSVIRGLVSCSRPEAWEAVEALLLAAQRQEGLRQVILEAADEGHPDAFRRILRLAVDNKLTRFASVVRAFDVWLGLTLDVTQRSKVDRFLAILASAVDSRESAEQAIASSDPEEAYCGLWAWAVNDAAGAAAAAGKVLEHPDPPHRYVAAHLLDQLRLPEAARLLMRALEDEDGRVAWRAFSGLSYVNLPVDGLYEALDGYLNRLEADRTVADPVWDWQQLEISRSQVVSVMLRRLDRRHPTILEPYLPLMDANTRGSFARAIAEAKPSADRRRVLVDLAADRSQWVARVAFEALAETPLRAAEPEAIEALLSRSRGATRAAAVTLLVAQADTRALASAERLLGASKKPMRLGGLDVLRQLADAGRGGDAPRRLAAGYATGRKLSAAEQTLVDTIAAADDEPPTLDDGLGLFDPADLTTGTAPSKKNLGVTTRSMAALMAAADEFAAAYQETPVTVTNWAGTREELYGNVRWLPPPQPGQTPDEEILHEEWADWWARQRAEPLDLERALVSAFRGDLRRAPNLIHAKIGRKLVPQPLRIGNGRIVNVSLWWRFLEHATVESVTFLLDGLENALAAVPKAHLANPLIPVGDPPYVREVDWREASALLAWKLALDQAVALRPDLFEGAAVLRLWSLQAWLDRPSPTAERFRPDFPLLLRARRLGAATDADVLDHLVGQRPDTNRGWYGYRAQFAALSEATRRRPIDDVRDTPGLLDLAERTRRRIIEVELGRGDVATAASYPGLAVRSVPGAATVLRLISALGRGNLVRGWSWNPQEKTGVLSHLIRVSLPAEDDTPASFTAMVADHGTSERRLLELAMYAPQWSRYVEHALGWDGLDDAVHWIHAHTKDSRWSVDADIRELWAAETAERTPLTADDLIDGAVDVSWFHRVYETLGVERWATLLKYAKFASGGGGHKRAEVFAQALLGSLDVEALSKRIADKRHQDSVRALGLVPLPPDETGRETVVLSRYQTLQEFLRTSKKFGSQRQTSEKRAVEVAMLNLARTAGHADPQRLQWAMEIEETADLAAGPITVRREEYKFELAIDDLGSAAFRTVKSGKALKSVPAKHRKDDEVVALRERAKTLRRQVSRVRASLEAASIRGDEFTPGELVRLHDHPVLRPMLANVLLTDARGALGFPSERGAQLSRLDGRASDVAGNVRLAHATDLLASDDWVEWQRRCFTEERTQPFKQIFRELYIPTGAELDDGRKSNRFAGHQVNPRQAAGVFGSRGWVMHPDEGPAKTFHAEGLTARVTVMGGWFTPAEVDGMTIEHVFFSHRGNWDLVLFKEIPPRLFSEVMRDIDLIVSVAHIGGVDPEASASTVEMRRALVRETAMLLQHDNVRFANHHVIIDGKLGTYSVHLGSGTVHRQPGGAVFIVPVGSQHRGRLFLPFADDDPKTAEVISKTVMLARDGDIKDPTILSQLV